MRNRYIRVKKQVEKKENTNERGNGGTGGVADGLAS
jgi:hypothetical protein